MTITIYTDGACRNNPGTGGFAWVAVNEANELLTSGAGGPIEHTTNNRMELLAAIDALQRTAIFPAMNPPSPIVVISDSKYVVDGISGWVAKWKTNGWRTKGGKVANQDLWEVLDQLATSSRAKFKWVKGHAGDFWNEQVDKEANRRSLMDPQPAVQPPARPPKTRMVCAHCGSESVLRDAWAEWNYERQEWVLQNVFDDGYCETCGGEASINEIDEEGNVIP